jgi:hypothetical protein
MRRSSTLTLLVDLSGNRCGSVLAISGTRYAHTYISLQPHLNQLKSPIVAVQALSKSSKILHPDSVDSVAQW